MVRFAAIALTSVLGVAGMASAAPAAAGPYVSVAVPAPIGYWRGPRVYGPGPWYGYHGAYPGGFYRGHYGHHGYFRR
jgi:hypothetical protein